MVSSVRIASRSDVRLTESNSISSRSGGNLAPGARLPSATSFFICSMAPSESRRGLTGVKILFNGTTPDRRLPRHRSFDRLAPSSPQVGFPDRLVARQIARFVGRDDPARLKHVSSVCDAQCHAGVLLHHEDGCLLYTSD